MLIDCNKHLFVVYGLQRAIAQLVSKWTELNTKPKKLWRTLRVRHSFLDCKVSFAYLFNENDAEKC